MKALRSKDLRAFCCLGTPKKLTQFSVNLLTMILLQLEIKEAGKECTAEVELDGIADSWDAKVKLSGHPSIQDLHIKFWMDSFILPVFDNRQDAIFFEPLFNAIDGYAKERLPKEFEL